ncbi:hypothetical protein ACF090_25520 [Streptomyces sp. NPDC014892]
MVALLLGGDGDLPWRHAPSSATRRRRLFEAQAQGRMIGGYFDVSF